MRFSKSTIFSIFLMASPLFAKEWKDENKKETIALSAAETKLQPLFNSLDSFSITQQLAFYELYPATSYGKEALRRAWFLLSGQEEISGELPLPQLDIQAIISLVTRQSFDPPPQLAEEQLALIERFSSSLANRKLEGFKIWKEEDVLKLDSQQIDLGRALLISQFSQCENPQLAIRRYEASMDLMALQIRARLLPTASDEEKIREINRFIFQEMLFRFPPHSLHAKDIDLYTFLPSVLDSRQGVCLGVSILYLCLAQRVNLPLEIITPPGHIFLRYERDGKVINIETTARGIHLPDEVYLGINTRKLEKRTIKEVAGLALMNQAALCWGKEDYITTVALYEKAQLFLPGDKLLKMFLGLNYLFLDKKKEGRKLLEELRGYTFDSAVAAETFADDYLMGKVDAEGLKVIFQTVDETRKSVLEKQEKLKKVIKRYPAFRAGLFQLATTWLQLSRSSEALEVLEKYHRIDPNSCIVEYYLSSVALQRMDFLRAWDHFKQAEALTHARGHSPKALKTLHHHLRHLCPDPTLL